MKRFRIKVCGMTQVGNLLDVLALGVDAIGVISCVDSPRHVDPESVGGLFDAALGAAPGVECHWVVRGVEEGVLDATLAAGLACTHVQLHGAYGAEAVRTVRSHGKAAVQVHPAAGAPPTMLDGAGRLLLDTPGSSGGGTGRAFDWSLLSDWPDPGVPIVLAGGLHPGMGAEAFAELPEGIHWLDLNSGVEAAPGVKRPALIQDFINLFPS